jgi:signal transduction histidine kinase
VSERLVNRAMLAVAVVLAALMLLLPKRREEDVREHARARAQARQQVQAQVAAAVAWMDQVLDDAARRASTADLEKAEDEGRALLDAMQPALRLPGVPAEARLALYDRHESDNPLVGRVTASAVAPAGAGPGRVGLTRASVEALAPAGSETGWASPSASWLWFECDAAGGVRLVRSIVLHEFVVLEEEGETEPVLGEGVHLLTVDAPIVLPSPSSVRCDVADGMVRTDLSWTRLGDAVPEATHAEECIDPRWAPWRFPSPAPGPRVLRHLVPVTREVQPWWMWAAAFVVATLSLVGAYRKQPPPAAAVPDVTAEAAHEMRTPLTAMRGALEVALRRERTPKEYQETLHLCLEEVRGLQNLQDAVLFLSRGARTDPAREEVDLDVLVEAEVARVRAAHPERSVALERPAGAVVLQGDPSLLARLIGNLLDNAALHSVPGGALRVALLRDGRHAVLTVEDDGPGVPAARRERIFERFFRGPEAARRGIPGSGLGLPIARWLAEVHGGTLELDPEPTDRARFRLRLPLR